MLGAGFDWNQPYSCTSWGSTFGLTYPVLDDTPNTVWSMFGAGYIPHNVIIDHNMVVRYTDSGFSQTAIVNTIQTYLGQVPNDVDGDGVDSNVDNCPDDYNPDQSDIDVDGLGDVCDPCDNANIFVTGNPTGDLDGDTPVIDIFDVLAIIDLILDYDYSVCAREAANINGDAGLNVLDAYLLAISILNGGEESVQAIVNDNRNVAVKLENRKTGTLVSFTEAENISAIQFTLEDVVISELDAESINIPKGWTLKSRTIDNLTTFVLLDLSGKNYQTSIALELPVKVSSDLKNIVVGDSRGQALVPLVSRSESAPEAEAVLPLEFSGIYPNPFNPAVTIPLSVSKNMETRVAVYNLVGKEIAVLHEGIMDPGQYKLEWNASGYPSGVYLIQVQAGSVVSTKKAILMK